MRDIDRRTFLTGSAAVGALGVLGGVTAVTVDQLMAHGRERPHIQGEGIVVVVTLYGGNDGINTVIPYANSAYHDARPELAYAESDVLHLDSDLGLNPALGGLHGLWGKGELAIVRGVGYPKPDRSHFRSMDIWQTASPDQPVNTGWMGRWLDSTGADPLRAVSVGSTLPTLAIGERSTAAALLPGAGAPPAASVTTLAALSRSDPTDSSAARLVCESYAAQQRAAATFGPVAGSGRATTDPDISRPTTPTKGVKAAKGSSLSEQLDLVARCIQAGAPTRMYSVSLGGFDTHADERGTQETLLAELDHALAGFVTTMADDPHGRDVVVMAYSEFGRRVHANASQGTDHGTSGPLFVAGAGVKGGFYGDEPSLTDLDNGDLKVTTDFRDVYAELLGTALGADPTPVVGSGRRPVGFL
ncbi:DUF1501 domain-containing protein [Williamsia sp. CHRR-6]|uniref:DUF1501 domain-containing protein n=1 Tax=Williamsia sp. CHRR-6 TaxID=2835871 RepID=UPI001BDA3CDA|nr:DUF1501 domain-containing protein [Williamsia sp. CHRR-6]MBT0567088.1 DUF1501 domain-containing protein [Williamsia sp. CHRR-6]